jgi:pimeloyl-ACP methyl ester carboxylesterase
VNRSSSEHKKSFRHEIRCSSPCEIGTFSTARVEQAAAPLRITRHMAKRVLFAILGLAVLAGGDFLIRRTLAPRGENQKPGKFPEEVVFARSNDDVVSGGVLFTAPKQAAKPMAVVWLHGWGANFYVPSYVGIGRALAERGFTTISANTRMHDIGNVEKYNKGKRVRGGGYWGVTSEDARDIAAWVDYAQGLGFDRVVLVGHSAGWASVARYQADTHDPRIVGMVFASGCVDCSNNGEDPALRAQAKKLVDEGAGDGLITIPKRSFPSYVSAATYLDIIDTPREYADFFGVRTANPAVTRVRCPILAFFGSKGDIATQEALNLVKTSIYRLKSGPSRVDTSMIQNGNHEYVGEEGQVAQTIAAWAATI